MRWFYPVDRVLKLDKVRLRRRVFDMCMKGRDRPSQRVALESLEEAQGRTGFIGVRVHNRVPSKERPSHVRRWDPIQRVLATGKIQMMGVRFRVFVPCEY